MGLARIASTSDRRAGPRLRSRSRSPEPAGRTSAFVARNDRSAPYGLFFRRAFRRSLLTTNQRDSAAAYEFLDAVRPHQFDERFNFLFWPGNLDHHLLSSDIHDSAAKCVR